MTIGGPIGGCFPSKSATNNSEAKIPRRKLSPAVWTPSAVAVAGSSASCAARTPRANVAPEPCGLLPVSLPSRYFHKRRKLTTLSLAESRRAVSVATKKLEFVLSIGSGSEKQSVQPVPQTILGHPTIQGQKFLTEGQFWSSILAFGPACARFHPRQRRMQDDWIVQRVESA